MPPDRWRVVGGEHSGGLVVREAVGLKSHLLDQRLAHGSLIQQVLVSGNRVKYDLLKGDGPSSGWISAVRTHEGKVVPLLRRALCEEDTSAPSEDNPRDSADACSLSFAGSDLKSNVQIIQHVPSRWEKSNEASCQSKEPCQLNVAHRAVRPDCAITHSPTALSRKSGCLNPEYQDKPCGGEQQDAGGLQTPALPTELRTRGGDHLSSGAAPSANSASLNRGAVNQTAVAEAAMVDRARWTKDPSESLLNIDGFGILRGGCDSCKHCDAWQWQNMSSIRMSLAQPKTSTPDPNGSDDCCNVCGCTAEKHRDLASWLVRVRASIHRFRNSATTRRLPPSRTCFRKSVLHWEPDEVALYVLTHGRFEPSASRCERMRKRLVSVCVPTYGKRRAFHPLLYQNFAQQTYEPKELVIVDTGRSPSPFLEAKAAEDPRVIYHFYPVQDSKHDRRQAVAQAAQRSNFVTGRPGRRPNPYEPPPDSWSLGLKRNVAAALSAGDVISHFDDDDLYAPRYLDFMMGEIEKVALQRDFGVNELADATSDGLAAVVKLQQWHLFDFGSSIFRFMDPQTDPLALNSWRRDMTYGYGFSYVYTMRAWRLQAFPDAEDCEDDVFISGLKNKPQAVVSLVKMPSIDVGLVAHSFHADNTGVMEFNGEKRLGIVCQTPKGFEDLVPLAKSISMKLPRPVLPTSTMPTGFKMQGRFCPQSGKMSASVANKGRGKGSLPPFGFQSPKFDCRSFAGRLARDVRSPVAIGQA